MPTIYREGGLQFLVWPNDHRPAHVHVFSADGEAVILLDPVEVWTAVGMRRKDIVRARKIVEERQAAFIEKWRKIHG